MARPGTESSNPSPSSGESVANLTSSPCRPQVDPGRSFYHDPAGRPQLRHPRQRRIPRPPRRRDGPPRRRRLRI